MATEDAICEQFNELGINPSSYVIDKCLELCSTYHITNPEEFVESWMAYSVSHLDGADPTIEFLCELERKVLMVEKREAFPSTKAANKTHRFNSNSTNYKNYNEYADNDSSIMDMYIGDGLNKSTQNVRQPGPGPGPVEKLSNPETPMQLSLNADTSSQIVGKVIFAFGNATLIKSTVWKVSVDNQLMNIKIKLLPCNSQQFEMENQNNDEQYLTKKSKFLYDPLVERCLIEDDRIYKISNDLRKKISDDNPDLDEDEFGNVNEHRNVVRCLGKIGTDDNDKLNKTSTILIDIDDGELKVVNLNFDKCSSYAVIPGQVVMIHGHNPRGDTLYVSQVLSERTLHHSVIPKNLIDPLNIVLVSGPYTNTGNLLYEPLYELMNYCKQNKPHIVILLGPFLDSDHKSILDGSLSTSVDLFFEKMVTGIMDSIGHESKVIMVSSSKDAHSNFIYPTPPYVISKELQNLTFLPDPCLIDVNGITIGLTSTDVIGHIIDSELAVNVGDRVKRCVNYLFHQASFYPLSPPSLDLSFDACMASKFTALNICPNILILPSHLKGFIRDINNCLVVNPGRLINDDSSGTFTRLVVHPPNKETELFNYIAGQVLKM